MKIRIQRYACIAAALALSAGLGTSSMAGNRVPEQRDPAAAASGMNILVILTDDQRFDTVDKMPNLSALAKQGVTFSNAYHTTPLCAPSRSMLFSGGYLSQNTGVLENTLPDGGVGKFNDKNNLGALLQAAGYRTGFVGKWVNGYESKGRYIPPGWTRFVGRQSWGVSSNWFSFNYMIGSSGQSSALGTRVTAQQYTTYYERDQVLSFMSSTASQPFFVLWSPSAPHATATPADEDEELFEDYTYRGRGYGETDLSDKPTWVRNRYAKGDGDEFVRDQLRSLQSVDRSVQQLVDALRAQGKLNNTLVMFVSDNGFMWGEHGLWHKEKIYEESLRVPFIVLMPGVAPRTDASLVLPSLDIGPTLLELAGVNKQTDGTSLLPLLRTPGYPWRTEFFAEYSTSTTDYNAIWAGIRDERWKYARYWNGEEELYDLTNDPYELNSRHNDPSLAALKNSMWVRTQQQLGLAIIPVRSLPVCQVRKQFRYQMKPWGGKAPLTWTVASGRLPPGLTLNAATGLIQGLPSSAGTYQFSIRVTGTAIATQAGKLKTFETAALKLAVKS